MEPKSHYNRREYFDLRDLKFVELEEKGLKNDFVNLAYVLQIKDIEMKQQWVKREMHIKFWLEVLNAEKSEGYRNKKRKVISNWILATIDIAYCVKSDALKSG